MSGLFVVLAFVGFMQTAPPVVIPPVVVPPAGNSGTPAQPTPPGPAASVSNQITVSDLPSATSYGSYLYDVGGSAGVRMANGGIAVVNSVWSLPDFLLYSRLPQNTVDQPDAAQLNDNLAALAAGLMLIGLFLVLGYQALSVLRGEVPNPAVAAGAVTIVAVAGLAAVNNRWLQHFPIDLVNLLLSTISGAPIRQFVQPVMHVSTIVDSIWAALLLLALILVVLGLTVILFIEGAWCVVLGALLGLAAFGSVLPIFGGGCQFLLRRWIGSLFSPVIVFTALRLAAPTTGMLLGVGAPDIATQFAMLAFLFVAWQAPGMMVGAISVSFPSVAGLYTAGRLFGFGRVSERMINRGGGGADNGGPGDGATRTDPPRSRTTPPNGPVGRRPGRIGVGTAATNRGWVTA